jgi:hypothetical protein
MSVQTHSVTSHRIRTRHYVTAGGLTAVAALIAWLVFSVALEAGTTQARQNGAGRTGITSAAIPATGYLSAIAGAPTPSVSAAASLSSVAQSTHGPAWLMRLTPGELAAGVLGSSYALPSGQSGPTVASVLAAMSPQTRRSTERLMALTFGQLAAGAAGSP